MCLGRRLPALTSSHRAPHQAIGTRVDQVDDQRAVAVVDGVGIGDRRREVRLDEDHGARARGVGRDQIGIALARASGPWLPASVAALVDVVAHQDVAGIGDAGVDHVPGLELKGSDSWRTARADRDRFAPACRHNPRSQARRMPTLKIMTCLMCLRSISRPHCFDGRVCCMRVLPRMRCARQKRGASSAQAT